eukprot:3427333-Rhodomonas_salina.1
MPYCATPSPVLTYGITLPEPVPERQAGDCAMRLRVASSVCKLYEKAYLDSHASTEAGAKEHVGGGNKHVIPVDLRSSLLCAH